MLGADTAKREAWWRSYLAAPESVLLDAELDCVMGAQRDGGTSCPTGGRGDAPYVAASWMTAGFVPSPPPGTGHYFS